MPEAIAEINPEAAEASLREALTAPAPEATATAAKSESTPQQTAETANEKGEKLVNSEPSDALATADKKPAEAIAKNNETQKPAEEAGSPFKKNAERLDKTWKAVNERKTQLDSREEQLKQQEAQLAQREQQIQLKAAKSQAKFTPEQYEQAATNKIQSAEQLSLQADGLDKRATAFEEAGEYGKAELAKKQAQDLREQASGEKYSAKQMQAMAKQVRDNPDPTLQQHQATLDKQKQHYLVEAAKQWPDVAKKDSEFQKQMAGALQNLAKGGLDANENPALFFYVADYVSKATAAARVPELEKELAAAQARVKEFEKLTAPGGGSSATQSSNPPATDFAKMSLEQQEAWLRANR